MSNFSKNLLFLRKKNNVTQYQLALQSGIKQSTISNWENGISEPDINGLMILNQFFDISMDDFVYSDLEKSNLIFFEAENSESKKSNLKSNLIGNLNVKGAKKGTQNTRQNGTINEPVPTYGNHILTELRKISQNIEQLRILAEKKAQ